MKRKKKYTKKVAAGVTTQTFIELRMLKAKTGHSYASLLREALDDVIAKYRERGYY